MTPPLDPGMGTGGAEDPSTALHEAPLVEVPAQVVPLQYVRGGAPQLERRRLPCDAEAEESVISAVLCRGRAVVQKVRDLVEPVDLHNRVFRFIYEAALALDAEGIQVDPITVAQQMRRAETIGHLRAHGCEPYLMELANKCATAENVAQHARQVREKALQRQLLELAEDLGQRAHGEPELDRVTERLREKLREVEARIPRPRVPLFDREHFLKDSLEALSRPLPPKLPFGIPALDEALGGGFPAGGVVVLAAPPKYMKTALLISRMVGWAKLGQRVIYVTGENTRQEIYARLCAHEQFGHTNRFHSTIKHEHERAAENRQTIEWMAGMIRVISLPDEEIQDAPGLTWRGIMQLAEDLVEAENKAERPPGTPRPVPPMLIVDYVEEMADRLPGRSTMTDQVANKAIMRTLKTYACRWQARVLAVCSVGRSSYNGDESIFRMGDAKPEQFGAVAKHSGYIDYAASALLALQIPDRSEVEDPDTKHPCIAMRLHLAFTREGKGSTTVPVLAFGGYCHFVEDMRDLTDSGAEPGLPGLKGVILSELAKLDNAGGQTGPAIARLIGKREVLVTAALRELAKDKYVRTFAGPRGAIMYQHTKYGPQDPGQGTLIN